MTTTFYTGNTKYGSGALKLNNTDGGNNSAFGVAALTISTEKWNTAVGAYSGLATTIGISNTSVGTNTLLENISGNYNTALGTAALCRTTSGSGNTAVGSNSIEFNETGENNTMIGTETGSTIFAGSNNICLGYKAGTSVSSAVDYSNCILIGNNVYPTASGQAIIGEISQISMDLVCSQNPTMSGYTIPISTDNTNKIATCAWVQTAVGGGGSSLLALNNIWSGTNTFNNTVSVNTAVSSPQSSFSIKDTTTNLSIQFNPQIAGGQWNTITQLNDSLIFGYASGTLNTSNLTLTTHSSTSSGVRITATTAMIGAGGTGSTPSSSMLFSATNAQITGTLSIDNNVYLNNTDHEKRQIQSSYYNFGGTVDGPLTYCGRMYADTGLVVIQSTYNSATIQSGKFIFYSDISIDPLVPSFNALEINSTSITTPCIINATSTLIGTSTLNMTGQNNINSYMVGATNFYTNNATSGIIKFFTNDSVSTPKNPLQLSSTGIKIVNGSLTFSDLSVQTTAYTGSVSDPTKLPLAGGIMTGQINAQNINFGNGFNAVNYKRNYYANIDNPILPLSFTPLSINGSIHDYILLTFNNDCIVNLTNLVSTNNSFYQDGMRLVTITKSAMSLGDYVVTVNPPSGYTFDTPTGVNSPSTTIPLLTFSVTYMISFDGLYKKITLISKVT
jgi:hypothetical protein